MNFPSIPTLRPGCGGRWNKSVSKRRKGGGGAVVDSKTIGVRCVVALVSLVLGVSLLSGCALSTGGEQQPEVSPAPSKIQPWEWWKDLSTVALVPDGDQVVMRSSHGPSDCKHDRHSAGDSRFLRVTDEGEGVIFSTDGAGAVTRIWMVMGDGVSAPLDDSIRLRVRIDGAPEPVVDLPLPDVFAGTTAPFLAPLVLGREASGGGNVSYVPIPFRDGCEVSLVGAEDAKLWFQVTARRVGDAESVASFTGREQLDGFRAMLGKSGSDPWGGSPSPTISGSVVLAPGDAKVIGNFDGPDQLNGIIIRAAEGDWGRLGLRFTFDDRDPQLIPVMDLFGRPISKTGATRSLLVGADDAGDLYCYFPMPFFERAKVELMRRPLEGPPGVEVEYALRTADAPPPRDAGYFGVQYRRHRESSPGAKLTLFELDGRGVVVGLVAQMSSTTRENWTYLEGDERIFINGEETPSWHGTGIEDLFNGGFFFLTSIGGEPSPYTSALAGAPYLLDAALRAVMYRLFIGDGIVFRNGIRAELEIGPTGEKSARAWTVAYYYRVPDEPAVEATSETR